MKKFTSFFVICLAVLSGFSNSVLADNCDAVNAPYSDNFTSAGSAPPTGWTCPDNRWSSSSNRGWYYNSGVDGFSGIVLQYRTRYSNYTDIIYTPKINVFGGAVLSFKYGNIYSNRTTQLDITISDGVTTKTISNIATTNVNTPKTYTLSLSDVQGHDFTGSTVTIGFRGTTVGSGSQWYLRIGDFKITSEYYVFTNASGNSQWNTAANWTKVGTTTHAVPTINTPVVIQAPVVIKEDTRAVAKSIVIDRSDTHTGSIEIMPRAILAIAGTLQQKDDCDFVPTEKPYVIIRSDASGNGVLAVGEHDGTNGATVYFYTKARKFTDASGDNWVNQFIGSPFNKDANKDVFVDYFRSYLYQFNPEITDWENVHSGTPPEPWVGYNLLRKMADPFTLEMSGTLVASTNHTYDLYYAADHNQNVVANSWTAPIDIASLSSSGTFVNCEEAIYLFNAGSRKTNMDNHWSDEGTFYKPTADEDNNLDGQFIALPVGSAPWTNPTVKVIPPMQSFIVVTTATGAKLNINYIDHVYTPTLNNAIADITAPTRAPQRITSNDKPDILRLDVMGKSGLTDRMFVLVRPDFTPGFDNGYDGRKMYGNMETPQLYALTDNGDLAIHCIADAEGTVVGFERGDDDEYMLYFSYDGSKTLYLNDLQEQTSTLINDQNTYRFSSSSSDAIGRFVISATPIAQISTGIVNITGEQEADVRKVLIDNQLIILRNNEMFDVTGKKL